MATSRPNYDDFDYFVGKCQKFVDTIESYSGDDPLGPWYNYLLWIEENYVIDFKTETIFDLILAACLCQFEQDERYKQDRRLIKLFIKFVSKMIDFSKLFTVNIIEIFVHNFSNLFY